MSAGNHERVKQPRVCPECGCDRWLTRDAALTAQRLSMKTRHAEDLARENGLLTYRLKTIEAEMRDLHSALQRKIVRQARAIRRFEERLRGLREKPWAMHTIGETVPGAECDAAQTLDGEDPADARS